MTVTIKPASFDRREVDMTQGDLNQIKMAVMDLSKRIDDLEAYARQSLAMQEELSSLRALFFSYMEIDQRGYDDEDIDDDDFGGNYPF